MIHSKQGRVSSAKLGQCDVMAHPMKSTKAPLGNKKEIMILVQMSTCLVRLHHRPFDVQFMWANYFLSDRNYCMTANISMQPSSWHTCLHFAAPKIPRHAKPPKSIICEDYWLPYQYDIHLGVLHGRWTIELLLADIYPRWICINLLENRDREGTWMMKRKSNNTSPQLFVYLWVNEHVKLSYIPCARNDGIVASPTGVFGRLREDCSDFRLDVDGEIENASVHSAEKDDNWTSINVLVGLTLEWYA